LAQKKDSRKFIVDTFAIISDLIGNITPKASEALELIRLGTAIGVIHYLVAYEFVYFWERTKLYLKVLRKLRNLYPLTSNWLNWT
jgi:predicted nucleic acid-binding protein